MTEPIVFAHAQHLRTMAQMKTAYAKGPMIVMVYEDWCGASRRAAPEFDKASTALQNLYVVDSQTPKAKALLKKALDFEPQYFPTILGVLDTKVIEMTDEIGIESLRSFQMKLNDKTQKQR